MKNDVYCLFLQSKDEYGEEKELYCVLDSLESFIQMTKTLHMKMSPYDAYVWENDDYYCFGNIFQMNCGYRKSLTHPVRDDMEYWYEEQYE